jgi:RNA polymerase sigma factor for flagellar operon FliA
VPIEDLYSAGVIGLLDAFGRFDPSKKVQFRTYAQFRIRGAILDSLRTLDWSPRELRREGRAVEQAIQTLTAQFHRSPTEIEIAQKLNIPLAAYQHLLGELKGLEIGTLHSERSEDSEEEELVYIPGRPEEDPLFCYLNGEMRKRLTPRARECKTRRCCQSSEQMSDVDELGCAQSCWTRKPAWTCGVGGKPWVQVKV